MELIDKSAVVAELEKLISNGQTKLKESEECKDYESYVALVERIATCINVESFLDTLEVKEVNFEKELDEWMRYGPHTSYPWCTIPDAIKITAEHFYELGLKAKKEE